jgi:hypothetical protein
LAVLCLLLGLAAVVVIIATIRRLFASRGVARGFTPNLEQRVVLHVLMEHFPTPLELGRLTILIAADKTPAHAAEEIDGLIRARAVREVPMLHGGQWYALTDAGRAFAVKVCAQPDASESRTEPASLPTKLAPEVLTPPVRRALLVLRHRVDARTTLQDLHKLIAGDGVHVDLQTTKAQLQQDMEVAERAGIVSIARTTPLTHYYNLTLPEGRDWVLRHERELQIGAAEGMVRRDPRSP